MILICSAGPRGLCGDPRIFDDLTKVPQVFRNPGGSPALPNEDSHTLELMKNSRRTFLTGGGIASVIAGGFRPRYIRAAQLAAQHGEAYRQVGVRPLINAAGTYTVLTGSLMHERARRAMDEASRSFVRLEELQKAAGERIAKLL